jgi:GTP-binding protein
LKIDSVEFVRSATGAGDLPDAGVPELSMVGRSNVGKSALINALVKHPVARTSATPGKTRLINLYRVVAGPTGPFYLVDLPGYGYVRGPTASREEFERLAGAYFGRAARAQMKSEVRSPKSEVTRETSDIGHRTSDDVTRPSIGVLLALDARHPGMENDLGTAQWLRHRQFDPLVVVTKIDKLSRSERAKALDRFEQLFGQPVLAVSAVTGEGLEDLWKQMVSWVVSMAAGRPLCRPKAPRRPPRRARRSWNSPR